MRWLRSCACIRIWTHNAAKSCASMLSSSCASLLRRVFCKFLPCCIPDKTFNIKHTWKVFSRQDSAESERAKWKEQETIKILMHTHEHIAKGECIRQMWNGLYLWVCTDKCIRILFALSAARHGIHAHMQMHMTIVTSCQYQRLTSQYMSHFLIVICLCSPWSLRTHAVKTARINQVVFFIQPYYNTHAN